MAQMDLAPLANQTLMVLTQNLDQQAGLTSFATTNALLHYAAKFKQPILHYWILEKTLILGMLDTRLPNLPAALQTLPSDYGYFVRNSGGLAVIADQAVLNLSLFIPNDALSIGEGYDLMTALIADSFIQDTHSIKTGEIVHSYCPGTYDLSINGRKFAGMSQRRIKGGIVVMVYLSVTGDQRARGEITQHFYTAGLNHIENSRYPTIQPAVMANLETLIERPLTTATVQNQINATLKAANYSLQPATFLTEPEYQLFYQQAHTAMQQRNQPFSGGN